MIERNPLGDPSRIALGAALIVALASLPSFPVAAIGQDFVPVRTADGRPDLNGIWQALGTAHWDLEAHNARPGAILELGALGAVPAGVGVVVGGEIPYLPEALEQRQHNRADPLTNDPAVKCYLPGVPRSIYQPFPMQIVQTPDHVLIAHEFASAARMIFMSRPDFVAPIESWMGHSLGHWEGDTLVVEVTAQVPDTWLDRSGNFHGENLHVTERFTLQSPYHLLYEATLTDPGVFSRPWQIRLPLYRRVDEGAQLLEFKCVEFVEEMMWGHLRKDQS